MDENERKIEAIKNACKEFNEKTGIMCTKLYAATEDILVSGNDVNEANKAWNEYINDMKDILLLKICFILFE
jgi:hypothetical protein